MTDLQHTILCVDDEKNILHSLKRLLRREGYRLLTASSGHEAFELLAQHDVQLIISDQRMPEMSGTEFLAQVKERYPDVLRIILTGYTDVDSITESINQGHIYKFFLKPWNDHNLKLEIRQALEQYDLIKDNQRLDKTVLKQNEKLKQMNEHLEDLVRDRTEDLQRQNQALELSHAILEDLPLPIVGVSAEGMIVLINHRAQALGPDLPIEVGGQLNDCFPESVQSVFEAVVVNDQPGQTIQCDLAGRCFSVDVMPLSGRFKGKGGILTFN